MILLRAYRPIIYICTLFICAQKDGAGYGRQADDRSLHQVAGRQVSSIDRMVKAGAGDMSAVDDVAEKHRRTNTVTHYVMAEGERNIIIDIGFLDQPRMPSVPR